MRYNAIIVLSFGVFILNFHPSTHAIPEALPRSQVSSEEEHSTAALIFNNHIPLPSGWSVPFTDGLFTVTIFNVTASPLNLINSTA